MGARGRTGPDWRDAAAYAPLLDADRSLFAWEWLRRDRSYRAAASSNVSARRNGRAPRPEHFGLVAFEPPHLTLPDARPLWRSDVHPYVLRAEAAEPCAPDDRFNPEHMGSLARLVSGERTEYLLLSDGLRAIRLDAPAGAFTSGPVCLKYSIAGLISAQAPLLTLRRFLALSRTGCFSRSLHPREAKARRWILVLRTWDALAAGAGQRQLAEELLRRSAIGPRWRSREASVRSQAQRLVRAARHMGAGGYRELLA
jgi:hypothetical protein